MKQTSVVTRKTNLVHVFVEDGQRRLNLTPAHALWLAERLKRAAEDIISRRHDRSTLPEASYPKDLEEHEPDLILTPRDVADEALGKKPSELQPDDFYNNGVSRIRNARHVMFLDTLSGAPPAWLKHQEHVGFAPGPATPVPPAAGRIPNLHLTCPKSF